MPFNYVAINDGCMAGLGLQRDFVVCFYLGESRGFLLVYDKADILQMLAPAAAAASTRSFEDLNGRQLAVISHWLMSQQQRQPGSQYRQLE